jgi:hypothetical protein
MKTKLPAMLPGLAALTLAIGVTAQTPDRAPSNARPVINGRFTDAASGQGTFSGTLTLREFEAQAGGIVVVGALKGSLADSAGTPLGRVDGDVSLQLTHTSSTCDMLRIEIGDADVDLDGRLVRVEKDVLGITTKDGPSRDELCALSRLLEARPKPAEVAAALNGILKSMVPVR